MNFVIKGRDNGFIYKVVGGYYDDAKEEAQRTADTYEIVIALQHQVWNDILSNFDLETLDIFVPHIEENVDRCICCGDIVPEGRQICYKCERSAKDE